MYYQQPGPEPAEVSSPVDCCAGSFPGGADGWPAGSLGELEGT